MDFDLLIIGYGSYGTALAITLSHSNKVLLWGRDANYIKKMKIYRSNMKFLPNFLFPKKLSLESSLYKALSLSRNILIAVPSCSVYEILSNIKPYLKSNHRLIIASKGLDVNHGIIFSELIYKIFGNISIAVLSGPMFSKEIVLGLPIFAYLATNNLDFGIFLKKLFQNGTNIKVTLSDRIISTQIYNIVKNIIAILVGISDGLMLGASVRSYLIFLGLKEMINIGNNIDMEQDNSINISNFCDLIMSCTENESRNRRFGVLIGKGMKVKESLEIVGSLVEGYHNIKGIIKISKKFNIKVPLMNEIYNMLYYDKNPKKSLNKIINLNII